MNPTDGPHPDSHTLQDVIAWSDRGAPRGRFPDVRLFSADGRHHVGRLYVTRWSDGRVDVHVRDDRFVSGQRQYRRVNERHVADGSLQVKVGGRYKPIAEALGQVASRSS